VPDVFSREERSRIMSRIRSSGNTLTELRLIKIMRKYRISGWRRHVKLKGNPDFVFPRERLVVFTDGDFWHGNPRKFRLPRSNIGYWRKKILSNRRRDRQVDHALRADGWRVIRFWQSALHDERAVVSRLRRHLFPGERPRGAERRALPCLGYRPVSTSPGRFNAGTCAPPPLSQP